MSSDDPFDDILNLEEEYYKQGYEEGLKDGAEAGRIEGYSLGLRKGFEKFVEAGRLQSKAVVWANRIPKYQQLLRQQREQGATATKSTSTGTTSGGGENKKTEPEGESESKEPEPEPETGTTTTENTSDSEPASAAGYTPLPPIHSNPRLEKNLELLYGLVEPGTISFQNDDEAVNDFDSRMKGTHGKLKIIEKAIGEGISSHSVTPAPGGSTKNENIEDVGKIQPQVEI